MEWDRRGFLERVRIQYDERNRMYREWMETHQPSLNLYRSKITLQVYFEDQRVLVPRGFLVIDY